MVMISWLGLILSVFYVLTACIRLCNGEQHVKSESTRRNILITQWQEWMDGCHLTQICHLTHLCEWKGKLWTSPRCPGALWVPTKLQIRNWKIWVTHSKEITWTNGWRMRKRELRALGPQEGFWPLNCLLFQFVQIELQISIPEAIELLRTFYTLSLWTNVIMIMKEVYPFCLNCGTNFRYPCFDFYHNISTRWSLTRMWSSEKANNLFLILNWNLSSFWKSFEKKQFQTRISCFHRDFCHRVRSTCCCIQWMMPRITNRCLLWRKRPNILS